MKKFVAMFLLLLCFGCVKMGKEISPTSVNSIVVNKTTKAQMLAMFGPPVTQSYDSDGKQALGWTHQDIGPFAFKVRTQILTAFFDENDVLTQYTINDNKNL